MTEISLGTGTRGPALLPLRYANRHIGVFGSTGTGKSWTVMRLVEEFAAAGVPTFAVDIKGDLIALERSSMLLPWSAFEKGRGLHMQAPLSQIGPELLSRALGLSEAQSGVLLVADVHAAQKGLALRSIDDLRTVLGAMLADREAISTTIGLISPLSVGGIQRALLRLERRNGQAFFGGADFDPTLIMQPGIVSLLDGRELYRQPDLYAAAMLFLLTTLYDRLPEVGDLSKPRIALVIDEAHILFADTPKVLLRQIENTMRLIRSKGVCVVMATQSVDDLPPIVSAQLGTRIDHARKLGVGWCHYYGLDATGKPMPYDVVSVEPPRCMTRALAA